jgi:hypothetical protein
MNRNRDGDQFTRTVANGVSIVNAMFDLAIPCASIKGLPRFHKVPTACGTV